MLQTWHDLRPLMSHPRRTIVLLSLCASIVGLSEAAVLVLVVRAALAVADGSSSDAELVSAGGVGLGFDGLLAVAVGLTLVSVILHAVVAWFSASISSEVLQSVRARALKAFFDAPWSVQAGDREGALQDSVSTLAIESSHLGLTFATGVAAILNLTALLAVAAFVDIVAMACVVGFGVVLFAALRPVTRLSRNRARLYVDSNSRFAEEAAATSSLAMDLRVFGVEARARERLEAMSDTTANRQLRSRFVGRFGSTLYRDLAVLFLVAAVGALQWYGGSITAIGTVVLLVVRALASAQQVHSARQSLAEQRPSYEAFDERMRLLESRRHDVGDRVLDAITSVDIESVGYTYADGRVGLDGVSLTLSRGEVVGIVGPSGSGKSTLVQVLLRLRPPTDGRVLVDGTDYLAYRPDDWSRAVSVVAQEPRLMEGSVADNIRFLRSGYSLEQVEEAAKLAHVDAAIRGLDDGYESWLGPRGGGLSGGQKQRVAIARALLGRPGLLVLDEPTSALDVQSEALMKRTIVELKGQITMVIVAHRITTLEACDRIVVMKDGRVESIGTPDELAQRPGFYRSVTAALEQ